MADEPTLYARVVNGAITFGPGALPYFWHDENGDPHEMHALTEAQREGLGFRRCVHVDWRETDPAIESRIEDVAHVAPDGTPVVTWTYEFTPTCRAAMQRRLDEAAEALRLRHITPGVGQAMVYLAKEAEARRYLDTRDDEGSFPLLDSGLGVDGPTRLRVAEAVIAQAEAWRTAAAQIETARLMGKHLIATVETDAQAKAVYDATLASLEGA